MKSCFSELTAAELVPSEGWEGGSCWLLGRFVALGHPHILRYIRSDGHGKGSCVHVSKMCLLVREVLVTVGLVGVLGRLLGGRGVSHAALGQ